MKRAGQSWGKFGAVAATVVTALVLAVLVGWPIGMVLHAAWANQDRAELGLTVVGQRAALARQTAALVAITLAVALPAGIATALVVFRTDVPGRTWVGLLCMLPALVPIDLHATAWMTALGPHGLVRSLGIPLALKGLWGAAWVHAMIAVPWVIGLVGAAVRLVEPELEEDCLLVAGPLRTIWHVTLRRSLGGIAAAGLAVSVLTAGEMAVTDLLEVRTYAETVYVEFARFSRVGAAAATALPGLGVLVVLVALAGWLVARSVPQDFQSLLARCRVYRLGRWRWVALAGCLLVAGATFGVPVASLVWRTGLVFPRPPSATLAPAAGDMPAEASDRRDELTTQQDAQQLGQRPSARPVGAGSSAGARRAGPQWSFGAFSHNFVGSAVALDKNGRIKPGVAGRELMYSLALAAGVSIMTVPAAWWLAWSARRRVWSRLVAGGVSSLLLALPGPVLGIGLKLALGRPTRWWGTDLDSFGGQLADWLANVADSPAVLVWLLGLRAFPFALLVLWPAARLVNRSVLEAAEVDGAGVWRQFWHVELPACWPAGVAAALVCAVLSLGEVGGSVIVAPAGVPPLSVRIFTMAHWDVENSLAGICLVLLAVAAAGALATLASLRWAFRSTRF